LLWWLTPGRQRWATAAGFFKGDGMQKQRRAEWFIEGRPAPQGSKAAFVHPHTGRAVLRESSGKKHKLWREVVHAESIDKPRFTGAVSVGLGFYLPRPKKHFRRNGDVKPSAPTAHQQTPDIDKLTRAVLDSLTTAGVIEDDKHVVELHANKWWSDDGQTGCKVVVEEV